MENESLCIKCGSVKKRYNDGQIRCIACKTRMVKEWRKRHPERHKANQLQYVYNFDIVDFKKMLGLQRHKCALCKRQFNSKCKPYVDHDHLCCPGYRSCGQCIRGLLCNGCNSILGKIESSPLFFKNFGPYMKKNDQKRIVRQNKNIIKSSETVQDLAYPIHSTVNTEL